MKQLRNHCSLKSDEESIYYSKEQKLQLEIWAMCCRNDTKYNTKNSKKTLDKTGKLIYNLKIIVN